MRSRGRGGVLLAGAALIASGAGCVGPGFAGRWRPAAAPPDPFIGLPAGAPVAGLGAKVSPRGLIPRQCLKVAESSTATGTFSVEVRPADAPFGSGDLATDAFVESCARRAEQARPSPGGPAPVAALLSVSAAGQWTVLDEGSAAFSDETNLLLATGEVWDFFERCGTRYVRAARREPSALVYVALYPSSAAQREEWAGRIARRAGPAPDDLVTLRVLDELVQGQHAFLAVRADADEAFEVVTPGAGPEQGTGRLVGNALHAIFGADRGRVAELSLRPWSSLPAAAALLRVRGDAPEDPPGRRERLFQRLKLLEGRALDQQTLLAQVDEVGGAAGCKAALERTLATFSWDAYYRCRDEARATLPAALEDVAACRPVLAALDLDALPAPCQRLSLDDGRFGDPRMRSDTRYPLLLEPGESPQPAGDPDAHLFDDARQLAETPSPGGVGAQTDRWGHAFSTSCLRDSQGPTDGAAAAGGLDAPAPLPKPWSQEAWDELTPRAKEKAPAPGPPPVSAPPEERPVCIEPPGGTGGEPLCLHPKEEEPVAEAPTAQPLERREGPAPPPPAPQRSFAPGAPPMAKAPAQPGERREVILGVSATERFEGRRGWPWWKHLLYPLFFGRKAPDARPIYRGAYELRTLQEGGVAEVRLTDEAAALARKDLPAFYRTCGTHRVRQVVARKGVAYHLAPGSPGDLEISVLPYGVSRKAAESAALHPERVQDFFAGRASWLEQLSARSAGLPRWLVLEPWSELLLEAGVVQPHQLVSSPPSGSR